MGRDGEPGSALGTMVIGIAEDGPAPREPIVEVLSARKTFLDGTEALAAIDFTLRRGEFVTLIGPSGCGKSTLLGLIAGLSPPTAGRIAWWRGGHDRVGGDGRRLAFVFQDANLMPWARIAANVALPLDLARVPGPQRDARVMAALRQVRLEAFARHYPRQLSGGMRMRASIARALVTEPDLLLMDEPFGALDEITRNRLDDEVSELWDRRGLSVILVTHSLQEAVLMSTRIVVMSAAPGRIAGELAIDEPFPRGDRFRGSVAFLDHYRRLATMMAHHSGARQDDQP